MGFPVVGCCPDMALPPFLVYVVLFLAHLRTALAWALGALGLGDLLDADEFLGDPTVLGATSHAFPLEAAAGGGATTTTTTPLASYTTHPRPSRSLCASLIREALPSSPYEPPPHHQDCSDDPESCAVCLHELESGDQVRRLGGCRHVFHASCIDPWVDLGRRTCPLCRAPLVPQKLRDSQLPSGTDLWLDAAPVTDSYAVPPGASYLGELYLADDGDYYPTPPDSGDYFFDDDISLGLPPLEHSRHAEFLSWPTLQDNAHADLTPVFSSSSSSS